MVSEIPIIHYGIYLVYPLMVRRTYVYRYMYLCLWLIIRRPATENAASPAVNGQNDSCANHMCDCNELYMLILVAQT